MLERTIFLIYRCHDYFRMLGCFQGFHRRHRFLRRSSFNFIPPCLISTRFAPYFTCGNPPFLCYVLQLQCSGTQAFQLHNLTLESCLCVHPQYAPCGAHRQYEFIATTVLFTSHESPKSAFCVNTNSIQPHRARCS